MTRPMTQRYLLVIVPLLLLWGRLTNGNLVHGHHNKQLRTQGQPNEKGSTWMNPMSLQFLIHPSDNQERSSELSHPPKQNPELVYPQRHSGKQRQLGSDISPKSGQVTAHSAQLGSIHSSESNLYSNDQPESSSASGSQFQVGHHHSHTMQTLFYSTTRVEYKDTRCTMDPLADLYCLMNQILDQQYTPSDLALPQPKKSHGQSLRVLLDGYNSNGNSKIKEEVKRIMKGPIQGGLGDKFPSSILLLEHIEFMINRAEGNCELLRTNTHTVPAHAKTVDENISWVFNRIFKGIGVSKSVAFRTLFITSKGLHLKERASKSGYDSRCGFYHAIVGPNLSLDILVRPLGHL
ncbi:hypothetical protein IWQ62_003746 [Dispira parvispora]|uniref:Uncharacterized protein n=1 Tax=Dispira parvispora TaxID=1520584 RepID=A0A9W8AN80_9FUNG|nr:hypothetical protein IWQ62_003746 [Dispira parvispora]